MPSGLEPMILRANQLLRVSMASEGQTSWQQKHSMHLRRSISAYWSISMALAGQIAAHAPQRVHSSGLTSGRT